MPLLTKDSIHLTLKTLRRILFLSKQGRSPEEDVPEHSQKWDTDENVKTILGAATKAFMMMDIRTSTSLVVLIESKVWKTWEDIMVTSITLTTSIPILLVREMRIQRIPLLNCPLQTKEDGNGWRPGWVCWGLGIGENYTMDDARELFMALRQFMPKNEEWEYDYRNNRGVIRDLYLEGRLYSRGDVVESLTSGLVGEVHRCATNHLICVTEDGIMFKNFIHDVQSIWWTLERSPGN